MIRVAVAGSEGRMGREVCAAVEEADGMELTGRADPALGTAVADVLAEADVLVDFTQPEVALDNIKAANAAGVHTVVGTTGFDLAELDALGGANILIAPNFAIGAVLMMQFAAEAAKSMPNVEIVELHHPAKLDKPSGTAALTAQRVAEVTGTQPPIHSVRLPGMVANQEVILGGHGETLTIRHDSIDRKAFMPGVVLAIRKIGSLPDRLTVGLEKIL
jgi:4-hydroxy-tetrahydrodipicolinate reductase